MSDLITVMHIIGVGVNTGLCLFFLTSLPTHTLPSSNSSSIFLCNAPAEDVDTPVCSNESSEWGGVATSWWKFAVDEYGWDVDPDSIEIVEAAWYPHRYNVFMRKNVKSEGKKIVKNLSRDDGPITTCPASYWNEEMNVNNAMEFDVDLGVVSRIWAEYEKDVRPHLTTGNSTDDFCLVTPYNPETVTWEHDDGVVRSDIKVCFFSNSEIFLFLLLGNVVSLNESS